MLSSTSAAGHGARPFRDEHRDTMLQNLCSVARIPRAATAGRQTMGVGSVLRRLTGLPETYLLVAVIAAICESPFGCYCQEHSCDAE